MIDGYNGEDTNPLLVQIPLKIYVILPSDVDQFSFSFVQSVKRY
jgi:hypothetical protein